MDSNMLSQSYDIPSADDVAGKAARKRKPSPKKAAAPAEPKAAKSTKAKSKKPRKPYTPSPTSKRAIIRPLRAMEKDLQQRLKAVQKQLARMEKLEF
jgi:BRCT domain type II-containing protein